jgi:hypothetical protein
MTLIQTEVNKISQKSDMSAPADMDQEGMTGGHSASAFRFGNVSSSAHPEASPRPLRRR